MKKTIVQIGITRAEGRILDQVLNIAHDAWVKIESNDAADINRLHLKVLDAAGLFRAADQLEEDTTTLREGGLA